MITGLAIQPLAAALALAVPAEPTPLPLFSVMPFADWTREGASATFSIETSAGATVLTGTGRDLPANSFLTSPQPLGDFTLEVEVRIEPGTNSGIQVRSRVENGRVRGPQVEIDPTPRAWSGGIYDEGDRGWMHPLEGREDARKAFTIGAWNRYRIECEGPRIRTWVNGTACADWLDAKSLEGLVAFQVHSGPQATVSWRDPVLIERGRHTWRPLGAELGAETDGAIAIPSDASGLRLEPGPWTILELVDASGAVIRLGTDGAPTGGATPSPEEPRRAIDVLFGGGRIAVRREGRAILDREGAAPVRIRLEPPNPRPAASALRPDRPRP